MVAWSSILDDEDDLFDPLGHRAALAGAIQKRRAAAAAAFLAQQRPREPERQASGPQGKKHKDTSLFVWEEHCLRLTEDEFKRRYRLTPDSFYKLLSMLGSRLDPKNFKQAKNGSMRDGQVVRNEVKLAIALRYLAGGEVVGDAAHVAPPPPPRADRRGHDALPPGHR